MYLQVERHDDVGKSQGRLWTFEELFEELQSNSWQWESKVVRANVHGYILEI